MAQSAPIQPEAPDAPSCPNCGTPMQTYLTARHVLRNGRTDSYCPSCALITCKAEEEVTTASHLARG